MKAIVDRILPQDDRDASTRDSHRAAWIDERLAAGRIDGYRYEDMPPDGEAHRLGLRASTIAHESHAAAASAISARVSRK